MCGGTTADGAPCPPHQGLSPRVRGNQGVGQRNCIGQGSIPACAGEPAKRRIQRRRDGVYPRVCGGTPMAITTMMALMGLSPRVRGNHRRAAGELLKDRSIPACAGEPAEGNGD